MIGIVAAMRVEVRCITHQRLPFNQIVMLGPNTAIWLCGMGADAAWEAARGLKTAGATALMSFGFAGALHPDLHPGTLVLPESIHSGGSLPVDLNWRARLLERFPHHLDVSGGILAASSHVISSATAKRDLAIETGACAVDMESGAVAEAATQEGLPFLAVRAISDPVDFSPPKVLLNAVRPDGSARSVRLLQLILCQSLTLRTLIRLARGSRAACRTLSAAVRYAAPEMGLMGPLPPGQSPASEQRTPA
jgi:adenosylhomocysteine nucleosidase